MTEAEQQEIINSYLSAYNNFDIDGMVALLHQDIIFNNISDGSVTVETIGIEQFREVANKSKTLFTTRNQKASNFKSTGNQAVVEISYEGELAVDLPDGMKKGEKLILSGRSEFEFLSGKISKITDIS